jgi:serine protease Do
MPSTFLSSQLPDVSSNLIERLRASVVQVQASRRGAGSGIVWDANRILTNAHVVGSRQTVTVALEDGARLEARVDRTDSRLDLAVLEVDAKLSPVTVGESGKLRVGEVVFALGHPWGQPWVVTAGVVSGLGAVSLPNSDVTREVIRSDVQLRPGNSGGPLLNASGEVIGVNAMVWTGDLGVAIPSDVARRWLASASRPKLGVNVQPVAVARGLERSRALMVTGLEPDGAAARAGMLVGDVIQEVDGRAIQGGDALLDALEKTVLAHKTAPHGLFALPDGALQLGILRAGKPITVTVLLTEYAQAA